MTTPGAVAEQAKNKATVAVTHPWVDGVARFGYVVRGILYIIIGVLALQVATGAGGETTGKSGAIATIGAQPFGEFLLVLVAVGLAGYSLWGFIRAIFDPLGRGADAKGIAQRIGYVVSGLAYGALVPPTVREIMGQAANSGDNSQQDLTAMLMSQPFGVWLVGLVGLIGIAGGIGQFATGIRADFKKDMKLNEMSANEKKLAVAAGRGGMMARGVVFALLGFFLVIAALRHDPKQAQGLDGALQTLAQQPYGPFLLSLVALGLVCFGVYSILCARWNHVIRS